LSARHHRLACACFFLFNGPAAAELYTLSLHDALPISTDLFLLASDGLTGMLEDPQLAELLAGKRVPQDQIDDLIAEANRHGGLRSEEHTSELQSRSDLVCRLLLEKKKTDITSESETLD